MEPNVIEPQGQSPRSNPPQPYQPPARPQPSRSVPLQPTQGQSPPAQASPPQPYAGASTSVPQPAQQRPSVQKTPFQVQNPAFAPRSTPSSAASSQRPQVYAPPQSQTPVPTTPVRSQQQTVVNPTSPMNTAVPQPSTSVLPQQQRAPYPTTIPQPQQGQSQVQPPALAPQHPRQFQPTQQQPPQLANNAFPISGPVGQGGGVTPPPAVPQPVATGVKGKMQGVLPSPRGLQLDKIIFIAIGIMLLIAIGFATRSLFSSGGEVGELVDESQEGISFVRPDSWSKSVVEDQFVYYTEGGADISGADSGLLLGSDFIGIKYETLGENQRETIRESFETQFTSAESFFTSDSCSDVGENKTVEQQQTGYDIAYVIEAVCARSSTDEPGGMVKMFIGWTDVDLHLFGVVADNATWEKSGDKLNQIIESIRPAGLQ